MVSSAEKQLMTKKALDKVYEHNRDYLSLKLTIPLGNTELKKVHTNQFLFTNLPKEFDLANWTILAEALNSNVNRFEEYIKNRWYIDGVDINVDAGGKAEMQLSLNAFPSSYSSYTEGMKSLQDAYTQAASNKTSNNNNNKSNAVTTKKDIINQDWVKKYGIPQVIIDIVKKICRTSQTDEQNVRAIFNYMDRNINYIYYTGHLHDYSWQIANRGGNCVDNSRFFRACCLAIGIKCNYVQGFSCCSGGECANHQWNKVYINGKGIEIDCGRQLASWGSHWGSCSGGTRETESSW